MEWRKDSWVIWVEEETAIEGMAGEKDERCVEQETVLSCLQEKTVVDCRLEEEEETYRILHVSNRNHPIPSSRCNIETAEHPARPSTLAEYHNVLTCCSAKT